MFFEVCRKQIKRVTAGLLTASMISSSLFSVVSFANQNVDISGLLIIDQAATADQDKYELVAAEAGAVTILQSSTSGYNSTGGSRNNATLFLLQNPVDEDFSMSLNIEVSSLGGSGCGIFTGAFAGVEAESTFTSMAFRGNNSGSAVGFGYKKNSAGNYEFGTTGTSAGLSNGVVYSVNFSRNGDVFAGEVFQNGSLVTSYSINMNEGNHNIAAMQAGAPLYPGISVLGATVKVSDWIIRDAAENVLFDSADIWGGSDIDDTLIDWDDVAAPVLASPVVSLENSELINLDWQMAVGNGYADSIEIVATEEVSGQEFIISSNHASAEGSLSFQPPISGNYSFTAYGIRQGESAKVSDIVGPIRIELPLKTPVARVVKNNSELIIKFPQVAEVETYTIRDLLTNEILTSIEVAAMAPDALTNVTLEDSLYTVTISDIEPRLYEFEIIATGIDGNETTSICSIDASIPSWQETPLSYDTIDRFLEQNLMVPMDSSVGSSQITGLMVPTLAYDESSVTLIWEKPEKYDNIADYHIYIDGELAGTARENFALHADWADNYMKAFYQGYEDNPAVEMAEVDIHTFRATGLDAETIYQFEVIAVDDSGNQISDSSSTITYATTAVPEIFDITEYGAVAVTEGFVTYDAAINQFIEANTTAIQSAIDACSPGGKVVIPDGIFMSGAIYLKSDMTLELSDGAILWGSPNVDHYDQNYLLYPYSTDTRSWALVNAYSADENGMIQNIRITGKGTIYGNGWKYGTRDSISGTGYDPYYMGKDALDPVSADYDIEEWVAGSNSKVTNYGILAADASTKGQNSGLTAGEAYSTRPNLVVLRGVEGIYLEDFYAKNPAFHTVAILDSKDIVSNNIKYITYDVNNADGIEIGNSQNALIFNNFFDTGDDSINFATGLGKGVEDSQQHPSENVWIFNNFIRNGHGGAIAAGSHTGAGIYNLLVEDNVINLNEMPFRFKSNPVNGGGVSNVLIRDCAIANCKQLFTYTTAYSDSNQVLSVEPADKPAEFTNIKAYNISADKISKNTFEIHADVKNNYNPWHTHGNMYYQDITLTNATGPESIRGVENVVFDNVKIGTSRTNLWNSISYSQGIRFINGTDTSSNSARAEKMPVWPADTYAIGLLATATASNADYEVSTATLNWSPAVDTGDQLSYTVDTYVDGQKVDESDMMSTNSYVAQNLASGVAYLFKIIAWDSTGNPIDGPEILITTPVAENDILVEGLEDAPVEIISGSVGYTWATARFKNGYLLDRRIRGYHVYVDGVRQQTLYNYQIRNAGVASSLDVILKRLEPGTENQVMIVAFTDHGLEYGYESVQIKTLEAYDYLAPVWSSDAEITVEGVTGDGKLMISWDEAFDESGIRGYRLYVDGMAVLGSNGKAFNHVNGEYTTKDTFYYLDIDLEEAHVFRVEAGDNWWKAVKGLGPYHWTFSGPVFEYDGELPEVPEIPEPEIPGGTDDKTSSSKKATTSAKSGWNLLDGRWKFADSHGRYLSGWVLDKGLWYFLNDDNLMETGWLQNEGKWYFLQPQGHMVAADWVLYHNKWYFLAANGEMLCNQWYFYKNRWYYLGADGAMRTNTVVDGYQINSEGIWIP